MAFLVWTSRRRALPQLLPARFQVLAGHSQILLQVSRQLEQITLELLLHLLEGIAGFFQILHSLGLEALRAAGKRLDVLADVLHRRKSIQSQAKTLRLVGHTPD